LRRKALAEESDIYRETLKIQIQNLRLYGLRARRKFTAFAPARSLLMFAGPFLWAFVKKRKFPKVRLLTGAIVAWKVFKAARSLLPGFLGSKGRHDPADEEELSRAM